MSARYDITLDERVTLLRHFIDADAERLD